MAPTVTTPDLSAAAVDWTLFRLSDVREQGPTAPALKVNRECPTREIPVPKFVLSCSHHRSERVRHRTSARPSRFDHVT